MTDDNPALPATSPRKDPSWISRTHVDNAMAALLKARFPEPESRKFTVAIEAEGERGYTHLARLIGSGDRYVIITDAGFSRSNFNALGLKQSLDQGKGDYTRTLVTREEGSCVVFRVPKAKLEKALGIAPSVSPPV